MDNSLIFRIRISDVNDHAPQFPEKEFNVSVRAGYAAGACAGPPALRPALRPAPAGSPARQCGRLLRAVSREAAHCPRPEGRALLRANTWVCRSFRIGQDKDVGPSLLEELMCEHQSETSSVQRGERQSWAEGSQIAL